MVPKINIINLGFNPWSPFWKRNQTIVQLLSQKYSSNKVLFLHSEIWLADLLRNPFGSLSGLQKYKWRTIVPRKVSDNITAFTPIRFPKQNQLIFSEKIARLYNFSIINSYIDKPFILIINDPQANALIVNYLQSRSTLTIFDWSDDFVEFSDNKNEQAVCAETCKKYCQQSDIVFTVNEKLRGRANFFNKNSFTVRNATNFFTFERSQQEKKIKDKIRRLGVKVVGYIGWLNSLRFDLELLKYIIINRPAVQFVFMGPKSDDKPLGPEIPTMSNVHILPPVSYFDYPAYLSALDVCILPNIISPHTEGNDPIKIYDYLASGNPIVSTKTAGTEQFQKYIFWANNKVEFLNYLDVALVENDDFASMARREVARLHSWQARFEEIDAIIEPLLQGI